MALVIDNGHYPFDPPNICPHCHINNHPSREFQYSTRNSDDEPINISAWLCANNKCNKLFIAEYKPADNHAEFVRFLNGYPKGPNWPKPISELKDGRTLDQADHKSSKFIKTYLQSLEAENNGLDELAGMGYRKAIEYLVKDWAIKNNPDSKDDILKLWLGQIIDKYYDGELKEILERATWLGNDQAHYLKLFEEYDLNILKELIELILVELDREYKKAHYIQTINKRK